MNTLIIVGVLIGAASAAFGQGRIVFANAAQGVDAPITYAAGDRILGPGPYVADFFWSSDTNASMDSLSASGFNTPFGTTPATAGYFFGGLRTLPGVREGNTILAQVRVWDTTYGATYEQARDSGGEFGFSNLILARPDEPPGGGRSLIGLQGFQLQIIPEPSVGAMLLLGGSVVLLRRRLR